MILTASVAPSMYLSCIVLLLMGCFVQAVGVVLELKGHVVIMSAEGLVARIADRVNAVFGYVKIGVDVTLVLIAVILSWFLSGRIEGGEGRHGHRCSTDGLYRQSAGFAGDDP